MGKLRVLTNECNNREGDRRLKEEFINGISDDDMMTNIVGELQ